MALKVGSRQSRDVSGERSGHNGSGENKKTTIRTAAASVRNENQSDRHNLKEKRK
jgi:hypothetical protein